MVFSFFQIGKNTNHPKQVIAAGTVRRSIRMGFKQSLMLFTSSSCCPSLHIILLPVPWGVLAVASLFLYLSPQETWLLGNFSSLKKTMLGAYCALELVSIQHRNNLVINQSSPAESCWRIGRKAREGKVSWFLLFLLQGLRWLLQLHWEANLNFLHSSQNPRFHAGSDEMELFTQHCSDTPIPHKPPSPQRYFQSALGKGFIESDVSFVTLPIQVLIDDKSSCPVCEAQLTCSTEQ